MYLRAILGFSQMPLILQVRTFTFIVKKKKKPKCSGIDQEGEGKDNNALKRSPLSKDACTKNSFMPIFWSLSSNKRHIQSNTLDLKVVFSQCKTAAACLQFIEHLEIHRLVDGRLIDNALCPKRGRQGQALMTS